jgi:hypothetical protein
MEAGRPRMADYGVDPAAPPPLDWAHAVDVLRSSRRFWLAVAGPQQSPVWAVWLDDALWWSCSPRSVKAQTLRNQPEVSLATEDAARPVIVRGVAELVSDPADVARFAEALAAKYEDGSTVEFFLANSTFRVVPRTAIAFDEDDLDGTATRWTR